MPILNNPKNLSKINYLWWIPAAVPLILILTFFVLRQGWFWGVMDDTGIASTPGDVWQRCGQLFRINLAMGHLLPVYCFYEAIFYKIFVNCPLGFYLFRWFEVILTLGIWGTLAAEVTERKWAAAVFITASLSFYKLFDGFYFLGKPDLLGMLFVGIGTLLFFKAVKPALDQNGLVNWPMVNMSILALILAVGTKEPYIVTIVALGVSTIIVAFKKPLLKNIFGLGMVLLLLSALYAIFIKFYIIRWYTAEYDLTDAVKILWNISVWLKTDLFYHLPWISFTLVSICFFGWPSIKRGSQRFGIILSGMLYAGYVLVLLPWITWGYYALPLGIFFALLITILLVHYLEMAPPATVIIMLIIALLLNISVASSALQWHYRYQQDAQNLVTWISKNTIFGNEIAHGGIVRGNQPEFCLSIPFMAAMLYRKSYKPFVYTPDIREIMKDHETKYYLWGGIWRHNDLWRLGSMWIPVFKSDNWVMYRRNY